MKRSESRRARVSFAWPALAQSSLYLLSPVRGKSQFQLSVSHPWQRIYRAVSHTLAAVGFARRHNAQCGPAAIQETVLFETPTRQLPSFAPGIFSAVLFPWVCTCVPCFKRVVGLCVSGPAGTVKCRIRVHLEHSGKSYLLAASSQALSLPAGSCSCKQCTAVVIVITALNHRRCFPVRFLFGLLPLRLG